MSFTKFYSRETVTSTMDVARELALAGEKSDTVVMAAFQTAGRGRQQRNWFAPRGANVCMTVIGRAVAASEAWQIALVAGVAAAEAVGASTKMPVRIRFPNDLYLNDKKIGGILVETIPAEKKGYVVPLVGIGVNVNIPAESFPEELRVRATSVLAATGRETSVGALTGSICLRLDVNWDNFQRGPLEDAILPKWRALRLEGSYRTFQWNGADSLCRVNDISGDGTVFLETERGEIRTIHAAQVILGDD